VEYYINVKWFNVKVVNDFHFKELYKYFSQESETIIFFKNALWKKIFISFFTLSLIEIKVAPAFD